ncbi:MAG: hypothetical protein PHZ19_02980 [Candidatus Thermoplasmatota archaeon]|nr:hypothetical protein [Candidatus Thermoplasmatota archaeon]
MRPRVAFQAVAVLVVFLLMGMTVAHPSLGVLAGPHPEAHPSGPWATLVVQQAGETGPATLRQMSREEAHRTRACLEELEGALARGDEETARGLAGELRRAGVFPDDGVFSLISEYCHRVASQDSPPGAMDAINLMSMVLGSGEGIFVYTLDVLVTFFIALILLPIPFGFILAMFYMYLWLVVSHALPLRVVQPTTSFWLFEGELTTVGLRGMHTLRAEGEEAPVNGSLLGFAGLLVNLIVPRTDNNSVYYYFCLGWTAAVLPTILPLLSLLVNPDGRDGPLLPLEYTKNL